LSKNVKRGYAEKVRRGEYPGPLPLGYTRDYKTKQIILDPEKWHYIKTAFQLYSTGLYSIETLAEKLYKDGLRSKHGTIYGASRLQVMLRNPFFFGWFMWKEELHKGTHPAIVSKELFDKVQEIIDPRKHLKGEFKRDFIFRGFMTCGECGLKITAEVQKGHTYYHCTKSRGIRNCSQKYIREETIEKEISRELGKLNFDDEVLELVKSAAKEKMGIERDYQLKIASQHQTLLERNKELQSRLVDKYLDGSVSEEIYNRKLA